MPFDLICHTERMNGVKKKIEELKELNENLNTHVATILDTKGPEVRTQLFENGSAKLKTGAEVIISMTEVLGNSKSFL